MRAALRLLWALDVRHLVAHRTRLALSALGIAVGVALAVGVGSLGSSITGSLESVAQSAAAEADIEIRPNGNVGLPPQMLGTVRDVAGVVDAGATIESYVRIRSGEREARVLAMGVDLGILAMAPRAVDRRTIETNDPFGVVVPRSLADELDVRAGGRVEVTTPTGWKSVLVGTVLPSGDTDRSRVVVGTVGVLQQLLNRGDRFDAIYVDATDPDTVLEAVQDAIGGAGRAGPVAFRGEQLEQLLASANASFAVGTLVALFVGAFLVYNTMAMAAVERLHEAALLRAVGAKRRQVFGLFLAEGGLLGLVGSALGVGLGLLLASTLLTRQGGALEQIYPIQITALTISPRILVTAGVAGVVAALVAAYLPARRISRADPAPALGPTGTLEDPTRGTRRATTVVGLVCALAGPGIAIPSVLSGGTEATGLTMVGFTLTLAGIALLIPTGVPLIARAGLAAVTRFRRTPGIVRLAAGEVLRSPGRTSFTVGAVLLSLALVVGFSIGQSSFARAFETEFDNIVSADLYVRSPTWRPFGSDVPLDHRLASEIESVDGVKGAWPFRLMPATYEDRAILVLAYDLEKYATHSRAAPDAKREAADAAKAAGDRDAVLVSQSFLVQHNKEVGDVIALPTPAGERDLEIVAPFDDPSAVTPEVIFDHATFRRIWGAGGADSFGVVVSDPSRADAVHAELERTLGPRYGLDVDTQEEYFELLSSAVGSVLQLIASVQLVAVVVAALGLANTLLISTLERRRDLGVLRAVGMLRRQLRRMVATEALIIGSLGVGLAWALGTAIGYGMSTIIELQLGVPIETVFPPMGYIGAAVLGLVAAFVASIYPAQRAARMDVVAALQYE